MKATKTLVLTSIVLTASAIPAIAHVCSIGPNKGLLSDVYHPRPEKFHMTLAGCIQFLVNNTQLLDQ